MTADNVAWAMKQRALLVTLLFSCAALVHSSGHGQTKIELLDYMRENRVALLPAANALGTDMGGQRGRLGTTVSWASTMQIGMQRSCSLNALRSLFT